MRLQASYYYKNKIVNFRSTSIIKSNYRATYVIYLNPIVYKKNNKKKEREKRET